MLLGAGNGQFGAPIRYPADNAARLQGVGDFNRDGKPDILVINGGIEQVSVLLNMGAGTFGLPQSFSLGQATFPSAAAIGDFDADGMLDVVVTLRNGDGHVAVLHGNGDEHLHVERT